MRGGKGPGQIFCHLFISKVIRTKSKRTAVFFLRYLPFFLLRLPADTLATSIFPRKVDVISDMWLQFLVSRHFSTWSTSCSWYWPSLESTFWIVQPTCFIHFWIWGAFAFARASSLSNELRAMSATPKRFQFCPKLVRLQGMDCSPALRSSAESKAE